MTTPATTDLDRERALFEAAVAKINPDVLDRWPGGNYKHAGVQGRWDGWLLAKEAAAALPQQVVAAGIDTAELRRLALAATPGPWEADSIKSEGEYGTDDDGGYGFTTYAVTNDKGQCIVDCLNNDVGAVHDDGDEDGHFAWDEVAKRDAAYIAAANPATILALLDALDARQPALVKPEGLESLLDECLRAVAKGYTYRDRCYNVYCYECDAALDDNGPHKPDCLMTRALAAVESIDAAIVAKGAKHG